MSAREVVEQVDIAAPPGRVWMAVSDPLSYGKWSPEATGARRLRGAGNWSVGDIFTGQNKRWVAWQTRCRVLQAQEDRCFSFESSISGVPIARWSYELEALPDGGTRLTERWTDQRDGMLGVVVKPAGLLVGRGYDAATRNRATMRATLQALKADLESSG